MQRAMVMIELVILYLMAQLRSSAKHKLRSTVTTPCPYGYKWTTAQVAQLVEQLTCNEQVNGSNPFLGSSSPRHLCVFWCLGNFLKHKQGNIMNKKEKIAKLIEEGKSFEEVVVGSGSKASYVKSQYTQLGLNWEDSDDPEVELKTIVVEAVVEEEEVVETVEAEVKEEEVIDEIIVPVAEPIVEVVSDVSEQHDLLDRLKAEMKYSIQRRQTFKYHFLKRIELALESQNPSTQATHVKLAFNKLRPRPTANNINKVCYGYHQEYLELVK